MFQRSGSDDGQPLSEIMGLDYAEAILVMCWVLLKKEHLDREAEMEQEKERQLRWHLIKLYLGGNFTQLRSAVRALGGDFNRRCGSRSARVVRSAWIKRFGSGGFCWSG